MKSLFILFVVTLSLPAWSQTQDDPIAQEQALEQKILDTEKVIFERLKNGETLGEEDFKGYSSVLLESYPDRDRAKDRMNRFIDAAEWGLLYQERETLVPEFSKMEIESGQPCESRESCGPPDATSSIRKAVENHPRAIAIRSLMSEVQNGMDRNLNLALPKAGGPKLHGEFYVMWGYNRARFTDADSTFKTQDGTFTIHQAHANDRPSPFDPKVYFNPTELSIPQYNLTIGYFFKPRWAVEVGQDHMKWVFDPNRTYEITGNYSPTVYVDGPNGPVAQTFDQVKATGNATWLHFEHTNGYNYPFVALIYQVPILSTKNKAFAIDARFGAGAGFFVPQTSVWIHRDAPYTWKGFDNQFHIAGGGGHASAALKFTFFDRVFLLATARGSMIKVSDALVDQSGARLSQAPISAIELMGQFGYTFKLDGSKKKKKAPLPGR